MKYEDLGDGVITAREDCLWCAVILAGLGRTKEEARADLAKVARAHRCKEKRKAGVRTS